MTTTALYVSEPWYDEEDFCLPGQSTSRHRVRTWAEKQSTGLRKALATNRKRKEKAKTAVVNEDDVINAAYYNDFRNHVIDVRDHLAGKYTEPELEEQATGDDEDPGEVDADEENEEKEDDLLSDDDTLPVNPFFQQQWTEQEKDAFFHAVSTHSRLRPDLIAASIKTKTMLEVSLYMRSLEDAIAQLKADEIESESEDTDSHSSSNSDVEGEAGTAARDGAGGKRGESSRHREFESDASKKARRDAKLEAAALERRANAPSAYEMGKDWVPLEERLARVISSLEDDEQRRLARLQLSQFQSQHHAQPHASTSRSDDTHIDTNANDSRKPKRDLKGKGKAREEDLEEPSPAQPRAPSSTRNLSWNTSNVYFVDGQLQILEGILRDAEDVRAAADLAAANANATSASFSSSRPARKSRAVSSNPDPNAHPPPSPSSPASTSNVAQQQSHAEVGLDDGSDVDMYILPRRGRSEESPQGSRSGSRSRSRSQSQSHGQQQAEDNLEGEDVCAAVRRRFLKRVYMRKQRALKSGGKEAVEAVDTTSVRLKPGRKPNKRLERAREKASEKAGKKRKRAVDDDAGREDDEDSENSDAGDQESDEDSEVEGGRGRRLQSKNEMERFKAEFEEAGIDEALLTKEGLGCFNLSMLGKLMNYFVDGYRSRAIQGTPAISAALIRVLLTTVVEFLVDVVHRSIVLAEARSALQSSKVWKDTNQWITVHSVKTALEIVGHPLEDRKNFIARLMLDPNAPPAPLGTRMQPPEPTTSLPGLTFHRSLHPPFVMLPREYEPKEERRKRYLEAARTSAQRGGSDQARVGEGVRTHGKKSHGDFGMNVDDPEEEDDPELQALCNDPVLPAGPDKAEDREYKRQLAEEEELDSLDMAEAREYEQEAWDRVLVESQAE
ncbi:hypothetical protein D9611_003959 [Ephemerocybe angulata]|uniref:Uncharacterized protein n=1 Tax=Ephemerocybe angulata TaxID=980116 RepID=A0A8H5B6Q0_9AGAR|nr:hypothetical protein D9611_003959 [Tulosesus angulatus]